MEYKKVFKCGIVKEQIDVINKVDEIKYIEVQLLTLKDNLRLLDNLQNKEIVSIHFPFECYGEDITTILNCIREKNEFYFQTIEIFKYAKKYNSSLVIHANKNFDIETSEFKTFIELIKEYEVELHIENVIATNESWGIKSAKEVMFLPLKTCSIINQAAKKVVAYPLLDICHYQINRNTFDSDYRFNLDETLSLYNSNKFYIHFNYALGCGDNDNNGVHGHNFETDVPLLKILVREMKKYNPVLILEVHEEDLIYKNKAFWLYKKICELEKDV